MKPTRVWTSCAAFLRVAGDSVGDVLSPPRCAACDGEVATRVAFCPSCAVTVERGAGATALVYGAAVATTIARFKYGDRPDLARPLGLLLAARLRAVTVEADVVVPVPLHPRRLSSRGYNQSALLGAVVARAVGVRHAPCALARTRDTPQQTSLPRGDRASNVEGAFVAAGVAGARVLLVDDVRTTGATLLACERALRSARAAQVCAAAVASAGDAGDDGFG